VAVRSVLCQPDRAYSLVALDENELRRILSVPPVWSVSKKQTQTRGNHYLKVDRYLPVLTLLLIHARSYLEPS
jgi:hypothetical protein